MIIIVPIETKISSEIPVLIPPILIQGDHTVHLLGNICAVTGSTVVSTVHGLIIPPRVEKSRLFVDVENFSVALLIY
jgi:hypothetical protein